jgi:hypothetical protein
VVFHYAEGSCRTASPLNRAVGVSEAEEGRWAWVSPVGVAKRTHGQLAMSDACRVDVERTVLTSAFRRVYSESPITRSDRALRVVWVASADRKGGGEVEVVIAVVKGKFAPGFN